MIDSAVTWLLGFLGSSIRWNEKITSSTVSGLPLWKVTPWRSLSVQVRASDDGVSDSASAGRTR